MQTPQENARGYPTAALLAWMAVSVAGAVELMPTTQQNALVQKYCAVCHTDAAMNGGLSLEHFDAANASPSLTAMLVSKLIKRRRSGGDDFRGGYEPDGGRSGRQEDEVGSNWCCRDPKAG